MKDVDPGHFSNYPPKTSRPRDDETISSTQFLPPPQHRRLNIRPAPTALKIHVEVDKNKRKTSTYVTNPGPIGWIGQTQSL